MTSLYMVIIDFGGTEGMEAKIRFNWGTSFDQSTGEIIKSGTCPSIGIQNFDHSALPDILNSGPELLSISDFYVSFGGLSISNNPDIAYGLLFEGTNILDGSNFFKQNMPGSSLGNFQIAGFGTSYVMFSSSNKSLPYTLMIVADD